MGNGAGRRGCAGWRIPHLQRKFLIWCSQVRRTKSVRRMNKVADAMAIPRVIVVVMFKLGVMELFEAASIKEESKKLQANC